MLRSWVRVAAAAVLLSALTCLLGPTSALAQAGPPAIPDALRPWVPWVLHQAGEQVCPLGPGGPVCAWAGPVVLEVGEGQASFVFPVEVWRDGTPVVLPGGAQLWPQQVRADATVPVVLANAQGQPVVRLAAGTWRLSGTLPWARPPESLPVPQSLPWVRLALEGGQESLAARQPDGSVWLRREQPQADARQDRLQLEVHRLLTDSVPATLHTSIRLQVAGSPREVTFDAVLPPGVRAHALQSALPARLDPEGRLTLQLRPGDWTVELHAHSLRPLDTWQPPASMTHWPAEETWAVASDASHRSVRVQGPGAIDPERTNLPSAWRNWPAWRLREGAALELVVLQRGEPVPPPDVVHVERTFHVDQHGRSITVADQVTGTLYQGGRLHALAPAEAGRTQLQGEGRVITRLDGDPRAGVEVRATHLRMDAELRYPRQATLPAVGWDRDAAHLQARVRLPPGWLLWTVEGPDSSRGTWISQWRLFDLFVVVLLVLATGAVAGWPLAALALPALVLSWHAPDAPRTLWGILLGLMALTSALQRRFPVGWLVRLRAVTALLLTLLALGFATQQTSWALFPHLERVGPAPRAVFGAMDRAVPMSPPMEPAPEMARMEAEEMAASAMAPAARDEGYGDVMAGAPARVMRGGGLDGRAGSLGDLGGGYLASSSPQTAQADPDEVVQTGPGLPSWSWREVHLTWRGPVAQEATVTLWLVPPALARTLQALAGLLVLALALALAARCWTGRNPAPASPGTRSAAPAAGVVLGVVLGLLAPGVQAQTTQGFPPAELLQELRGRLLEARGCVDGCVETPRLHLQAREGQLTMEAEVHAAGHVAWPLPGPSQGWTPLWIELEGSEPPRLHRADDGVLWLLLPPGVHRVRAGGPAREQTTLRFVRPPRSLSWQGEGWSLAGWSPGDAVPASVEVSRTAPLEGNPEEGADEGDRDPVELPPMLQVTRTLDLGLTWAVQTTLTRTGSHQGSLLVRLPLMPGEHPTTAGIRVDAGMALVPLEAGMASRSWQSTLEQAPTLTLTVPADAGWTESWVLACAPLWHCTWDRDGGLPPSRHIDVAGSATWSPRWQPWAGESLTLAVERPTPVEGDALTIDQVNLQVSGRALRDVRLTLRMRTSVGGEQRLQLNPEARLQSFHIDGTPVPASLQQGVLTFHLEPGTRSVEVAWREAGPTGWVDRTPQVVLPYHALNLDLRVEVPANRWLLWAGGPAWGPVVLLWRWVVGILIAGWLLARWSRVPISWAGWVVLGLGTSQAPTSALLLVMFWLVLLAWLPTTGPMKPGMYNVRQLFLAGLTLVALGQLLLAVSMGLSLDPPDMGVRGAESWGQNLHWYQQATDGPLPIGWTLSVPLWVWHGLMLAWSLWLSWRTIGWLRWGWAQATADGVWRGVWKAPAAGPGGGVEEPGSEVAPAPGVAPPDTAR